jgi:hypothetical protein
MITADMLTTLTKFSAHALTRAIRDAGYTSDEFTTAEFVGMTNAGKFCYKVTYSDDDGVATPTKVFLGYDMQRGAIVAEY